MDNNRIRLEADLRNQSFGIYNNAGKDFLKSKFQCKDENLEICKQKTQQIHAFLNGQEKELELDVSNTPIRWTSGGVWP